MDVSGGRRHPRIYAAQPFAPWNIVFSNLSERGRNQQGPFQTDKRHPAELDLFSSLRVIGYL